MSSEMTLPQLDNILSTTVKFDKPTKRILFLGGVLTYTDEDQINIGLVAGSSTGKTYDAVEIYWYFPKEDIIELQGASKTSFIHKSSAILVDKRNLQPIDFSQRPKKGDPKEKWDAWNDLMRNKIFYLNYRKKIILLPDVPDAKLFASIRPLLSHDREFSQYSVTDPNTMRTKETLIRGFSTFVFNTTKTFLEEQEITRFYLLTPDIHEEKIREDLKLISRKHSDVNFDYWYRNDADRVALKQRVLKVKEAKINKVLIPQNLIADIEKWFIEKHTLKPKSHRDYPRFLSLAKGWALLNFEHRITSEIEGKKGLFVNEIDIEVAKEIYRDIVESNERGLTPETWELYQKVVLPELQDTIIGKTIDDFHKRYFEIYKRLINAYRMKGMLRCLEQVGLITKDTSQRPHRYLKT